MQPDLLSQLLPRTIGPTKDTTQTAAKTDAQSDLRMGVVTAVTTRGITVAVGAQSINAAHLSRYAPAIGDAVALLAVQDTWLALDRVVGPGTPTDLTEPGSGVGPGFLGATSLTGISGSTLVSTAAGPVDVPKYAQSYYHPQNHAVMVVCGVVWTASATTASATYLIQETTASITPGFFRHVAGVTTDLCHMIYGVVPAAQGGTQRSVKLQVSATGGTITVKDGIAAGRGFMYLLDLGDQSFVVTK
jgi:hypothetical protein